MSNSTTKPMSNASGNNVLRAAHNEADSTIAVSGFVSTKVGHKIVRSIVSTVVDDYMFYDGANLLYTLRVTYNNVAHDEIDQVERIV